MQLEMYRGDTPTWDFAAKEADASVLDVSSGELYFTAKSSARQADVDAVLQKTVGSGITVTDGPNGLFSVKLDSDDTSSVYAPTTLLWDVQWVDGGGNVFTLMTGDLLVKADITSTIS